MSGQLLGFGCETVDINFRVSSTNASHWQFSIDLTPETTNLTKPRDESNAWPTMKLVDQGRSVLELIVQATLFAAYTPQCRIDYLPKLLPSSNSHDPDVYICAF
jgi:hypothetical protein